MNILVDQPTALPNLPAKPKPRRTLEEIYAAILAQPGPSTEYLELMALRESGRKAREAADSHHRISKQQALDKINARFKQLRLLLDADQADMVQLVSDLFANVRTDAHDGTTAHPITRAAETAEPAAQGDRTVGGRGRCPVSL